MAKRSAEKEGQRELRFPDNRSLTLYFMRGSIPFFIGSAVFACLVALFDLIIPRMIQYTVDAVIGGDLSAVPSWAAGIIEQLGGAAYLRTHLWLAAAGVAAAAAAGGVSRYAFRMNNEMGAERLMRRTRDELFRHILSLPYAWQGENSAGDIIQRCTSDVETIKIFVSEQLTSLLHVFILIFMSLYFMVTIQPKLTAAAAVFIPIMIISSLIFYGLIGEEFDSVDREEAKLSAIAQENLTGVRVVRTFGREEFEKRRFEAQNEMYTGHWIRLMRVLAGFWVSGNVIATTRNMTVAVFGAVLCVRGELTAGGLIAFLSYNALMSLPIRRIGRVIADLSKMGVSMERLRYIMNAEPEEVFETGQTDLLPEPVPAAEESSAGSFAPAEKAGPRSATTETAGPRSAPTEKAGPRSAPAEKTDPRFAPAEKAGNRFAPMDRDIVFSNVHFRYTEDSPEILRGVDLTIRAGTTVGILGATGAGKSTLVQLLDRLWDLPPENGSVTVGGIDIREMDRGWLRSQIGMVLQEPYLFSRTLAENIAIAMPKGRTKPGNDGRSPAGSGPAGSGPSESGPAEQGPAKRDPAAQDSADREFEQEEIRRAAETACLDEAVGRFADGYDTFVGERGVTLSGGQKQRAAIAQMLVRHTPVMIFDDSLSSVDAETDARIRRALQQNTREATVILIAHRITTLQQADEIFVLDKGVIAEHGTHEELIARGGIYSRVYALQTGAGTFD